METEPLDQLLTTLASGGEGAIEKAFLAYQPCLCRIVQRSLPDNARAKFDALDVVQSVWAHLLRGFRGGKWQFADGAQLRAFLVKATRNRLRNRLRHHVRALGREQPYLDTDGSAALPAAGPRPSELAQAKELWDRMLASCSPAHRKVLRLKRQGLSLAEVARRCGLHPSSVRRILYQVAHKFVNARGVGTS